MLQALAETVKSATWQMTMPTTDAVPTILTILHRCYMSKNKENRTQLSPQLNT